VAHVLGHRPRPAAFLVVGKAVRGHSTDVRQVDDMDCRLAEAGGKIGLAMRVMASARTVGGVVVVEISEILVEDIEAEEDGVLPQARKRRSPFSRSGLRSM